MQSVKVKSAESFEHYFHDYYYEMYYVAKRFIRDAYLAEDILQEAYIKAYNCQHMISDPTKVKAWLRTIVTRTAIDYVRKEAKSRCIPLDLICHDIEGTQETYLDCKFNGQYLQSVIVQLPINLQHVVLLKINDYSHIEIAEKLNISISAVKTRLHRARKQLKQLNTIDNYFSF